MADERNEITTSVENANRIVKALEVPLDYLTGLSNIYINKSIGEIVMSFQKLNNDDREHIFTTINTFILNVKAGNTLSKKLLKMTDLIGLILGLFDDLKFWKKKERRRKLEKENALPKNIMLDSSAKIFIGGLIVVLLIKLYNYLF